MKKSLSFIALGAMLGLGASIWLGGAASQTASAAGEGAARDDPPDVFVAVDSVGLDEHYSSRLAISGILEGESTVSERYYHYRGGGETEQLMLQRCERLALLALAKPGAYRLTISGRVHSRNGDREASGCQLARNME